MRGIKKGDRGRGSTGWLSREDRLPRLAPRKVNCRLRTFIDAIINYQNILKKF
jgi:hypothetical protein